MTYLEAAQSFRVNKYLLVALLYFFVDVLFLEPGLTYTSMLAPLFLYWVFMNGGRHVILKFILFILPFSIVHLINGVEIYYYARSAALYFTIYIFSYAIYIFVRDKGKQLEMIFRKILSFNFIMVLIAVLLFFTPLKEWMWTERRLTTGVEDYPRLQLFTFEPSQYSMLFAPVALYYILKVLIKTYEIRTVVAYMAMVFIPLVLSFSLGVLGSLGITLIIISIVNLRRLIVRRQFFNIARYSLLVLLISLVILIVFFPDNALFYRIENLFSGKDTSGKGRTYEAIQMAYWIVREKSYVFGAGFGQIKVVGEHIIREYYHYNKAEIPVITIPSSTGEVLAVFGFLGLFLKFAAEIYLYFRTRTYDNYFREACFYFIFIYQLTGGNLISIPEYVLWIIAFTPCCSFFDKRQLSGANLSHRL